MKYNGYEYNPLMSKEEFVEANEDWFVQSRLESNPEKAYMINDGDIDKFYDDIGLDNIKQKMLECYEFYLDDNYS
jgi:hypothetical protein